ncbi:MAG: hypothetical protein OXG24_06015 [Gammaproteobacteria bacterium]|nr:hypothetical protein [Gammaproteobacteria bacterium]
MNEILAITRCTIRELARSYHYKLLFIFLSLLLQLSFFVAALYQTYFTTRSPNLAYNGMQFVVGNVDSTHFFLLQFVVVALALIHFERMQGSELMESVKAKSHRNICWTIGTAVGISILVYGIALVNVIVLYGISLQGQVIDLDFGPAPELMSMLNLVFVDVPTTILFYGALTLVFYQIRQSKLFAGTAALTVAFLHSVVIQSVPFSWREIVSYSTTNSLLASEILPQFSTGWILFNRLVWIVLALGLLVVAALLDSRRDKLRSHYLHVALVCVGAGIACACVHSFVLHRDDQAEQRMAASHRISESQDWLDLTHISGRVEINPGIRLFLDVELSVKKKSDQSLNSLQFSFNPGMDLQQVRVDGQEHNFSFSEGLVNIQLNSALSNADTWIVSIRGSGVPDVNFGYPEPKIDYLGSSGHSLQMPKLLGLKNSIFDRRFVALMPGIRWYPVPLPLGTDKWVQSMQSPADTYSVDLDIQIAKKNWKLAAPERILLASGDSVHYRIQSGREMPHFAIVASEFQSRTMQANGVEIELLIHEQHFQPTETMTVVWNSMLSYIADGLSDLSAAGLPFPYKTLTFVEVPNQLRLVGGYDMSFLYSQPGVVFLRESGFPTAKWDQRAQNVSNLERYVNEIQRELFFYDYTNIIGGNILSSVSEQYFPFLDQSYGWEGIALNFLKRYLIIDIMLGPEDTYYTRSDVSLIKELADLTVIYPNMVLDNLFRVFEQPDPTRLEFESWYRLMFNDASYSAQSTKMSELLQSEDIALRRSALEHRLAYTYGALVGLYGNAKLRSLLDQETERIVKQFNSPENDVPLGLDDSTGPLMPILKEWNESTQAPAFSISDLKVVRVAVKDASFTHRASFKLRNDADVTGVVSFSNELYDHSVETGICVEIPGKTAYEVNLYAEEEIYGVGVNTFWSENLGGEYLANLTSSSDDLNEPTIEEEYRALTETSWNPHDENIVIVDNLDTGFSLVNWDGDQKSGLIVDLRWPWQSPSFPTRSINGIERFDWTRPRTNTSWRFLEQSWVSYGRYRPTALATHGTNVEIARFSADIPANGRWSLSYHLLSSRYPLEGRLGVHTFVLHNAETEWHFQVDPKEGSGWIHAGEFDISNSSIHLDLVSVEPANSLRVADAIRWKLLEERESDN